MSWLARSIANSLKFDDDDNDDEPSRRNDDVVHQQPLNPANDAESPPSSGQPPSESASPRGVKEDISELTKTISRQFWGVASFLAPPPEQIRDARPHHDLDRPGAGAEREEEEEDLMKGIRSDFAEIGGKFKSGISMLSSNIAVSEITKMASNLLQIGSEGTDLDDRELIGEVIGVTEEVVLFARDLAMHPETWLDFPIPDDDSFDEFEMSDAQQEHALAVERLSPRLAALRIELCPGYMSESCFWNIYFVLLHPRISKEDALLLSSPQIVEARAALSNELKRRPKANPGAGSALDETDGLEETSQVSQEESLSVPTNTKAESEPPKPSVIQFSTAAPKAPDSEAPPPSDVAEIETEKHSVQSNPVKIIDKNVVEEQPINQTKPSTIPSSRVPDDNSEDDADDWLKEETSDMVDGGATAIPIGNDEDVSFSDLEDDDDDVPVSDKKVISGSGTSGKDSRDWAQLNSSSDVNVKDINPVSDKHATSEQVRARNSQAKESNDWLDVEDIDGM